MFFAKIFNNIVRIDSKSSIFHHFPKNPIEFLLAMIKTLLSGYLIYSVEMMKYGKYLKGLKSLEGTKSGKVALVVANGPSCNKIDWSSVSESQVNGNLEIFGLNDSFLLSENSLARVDYLLKSDPQDKSELLSSWDDIISRKPSNSDTKLITPLNWHSPESLSSCRSNSCLHLVDVGRNHFRATTNPLRLRTYPPMGSFKLLAIARHLGYEKVFVIGLDNTFFQNVTVDKDSRIIQGSIHYKLNYQESHSMSHHFPNGIADYFHFVSQNFLALRNYFNDELYINLDRDSLNDTFKKIQEDDIECNWVINS